MTNTSVTAAQPLVHVVDDDDGMRVALTTLMKTVGYAVMAHAKPHDFLRNLDADQHGCVVLDVRMPEMSGLELQQRLNQSGCILPVIFITGHGDVPMAVQAMKEGAFDFLQKPFRDHELLDRVNSAIKQDAENRLSIEKQVELARRLALLTTREREVMNLIVEGSANKVIAIDLGISERTVEIHRSHVMEKMGARSVAHLVKMHLMTVDKAHTH
jgi:FixJ family two-component response regulator